MINKPEHWSTSKHKAKKIHYHGLLFDSIAERDVYIILCKLMPTSVQVQTQYLYTEKQLKWKLDFRLYAINRSGQRFLSNLCNFCNKTNYSGLRELFIEYKGIADKNFFEHMKHVNETLSFKNKLVLLTFNPILDTISVMNKQYKFVPVKKFSIFCKTALGEL